MSDEIEEVEVDTAEAVETEVDVDENEPVFFNPKSLNLVATTARVLSWIVLVGFVGILVGNIFYLVEGAQGASLGELMQSSSVRLWMFTNLLTPLLTGATFFVVLQGVCGVIDALFEVDFNTRETK